MTRIYSLVGVFLVAFDADTFEVEIFTSAAGIVFSYDFDASLSKGKIFS
jgi:hypothetical protein